MSQTETNGTVGQSFTNMKHYKYILEPYKGISTRYECPKCAAKRSFARYVNTETGEYVHEDVGRCNREDKCGYHYTPKEYFQYNHILIDKDTTPVTRIKSIAKPQLKPSYIDVDIFKKSLQGYENNCFIQYLITVIGAEATCDAISKYYIGTSNHWSGSTVFWQIDTKGRIYTGKIMLYDGYTGKRVKKPYNHIGWVHNILKLAEFNLKQCLFGEHLLSNTSKPIAIVESEKTAVIASCYLPKYIWLATGGCGNLNIERCEPLRGRNVALFPDAGKYNEWQEKAQTLASICSVTVSSLIETKAPEAELKEGFDLADYLTRFSPIDFINKQPINKIVTGKTNVYPAFVSANGTLYIPTPPDKEQYTIYSSVEAYNKRLEYPVIVSKKEVEQPMTQVLIDLQTLRI